MRYSAIARSAFLAGQTVINSHKINYLMGALNSRLEFMCTWHQGWITSEAKAKYAQHFFCQCWPVTTIPQGYQKDCEGQIDTRGWVIPAAHFVKELTLNKILESLISPIQTKLDISLPAGEENGI